MTKEVHIIGGGLAGCEAAWQVARAGGKAILYEMRPEKQTPAHKTASLAELVCSNSLKTEQENSASRLLKDELRRLGSLLIDIADRNRVPAGHALTVDREIFAAEVTRAIENEPAIELRHEEIASLTSDRTWIIASGPLTSDALASEIARITGSERLFFYDSISPIVDSESIDTSVAFRASRYGKSIDGTDDYLNCPFDRDEYEAFLDALLGASSVPAHIPEDSPHNNAKYFEACLPIEEIARRGRDTLRFGPMKPMGLTDPRTGKRPWAAVQLRQENLRADSYNLVGFQNHLRFAEQKRVFRLIPGLEKAEFLRYGQIHRNTYINGPSLLAPTLQLRAHPHVLFAGQICGVEGYVESIATGLMAGMNAAALAIDAEPAPPPRATAFGSLVHYITQAESKNFQPANITFDLLPALDTRVRDRKERRRQQCEVALRQFDEWYGSCIEQNADPSLHAG